MTEEKSDEELAFIDRHMKRKFAKVKLPKEISLRWYSLRAQFEEEAEKAWKNKKSNGIQNKGN